MLDEPTEEEIEECVDMAFEVWESEVRNRIKTEADINDSELQHGGPHMVEVLNSSQPGSERKGERPQTDSPTFWIWPGNGILDAPTPGFRTEGRHLTNAEK